MNQSGASPTRGGLGRGLDALIHRGNSGVQEIELERIAPNPQQPRQQFDPEALEELAASIRQHGLLQPVVVMRDGAGYILIAGERRWRAAKIAGLTSLPALVKDASPAASLELALVENVQRADLTPLEEASAYRTLLDEHGLTQEQVAARVGRSRVAVTNRLRLLALPANTKARLADGSLTEGHARALLGLSDPLAIDAMAEEVVRRRLSVRETEELVRRAAGLGGEWTGAGESESVLAPPPDTRAPAPDLAPLEEELQRALGTRVQLVRSRRGGKLVIHYYDADQLDGLLELLLGRESA